MHGRGVGLDFAAGVYFYLAMVACLFVAYHAMKFTSLRRERLEKDEQRRQREQEKLERGKKQ